MTLASLQATVPANDAGASLDLARKAAVPAPSVAGSLAMSAPAGPLRVLPTSFLGGAQDTPIGLDGIGPGVLFATPPLPGLDTVGAGQQGDLSPDQSMGSSDAEDGSKGASTDEPKAGDPVTQAFDKLHKDLQAIHDKSQVTPALLAAVRKDFEKIQAAAISQPDQEKLKTLMDDINAYAGRLPNDAQKQQVKADFTAVLQSQGITDQTLIDQTIADVEAVDNARNLTADDLATIAADREAIETALNAATTMPTTEKNPTSDATATTTAFTTKAATAAPALAGRVMPFVRGALGGYRVIRR